MKFFRNILITFSTALLTVVLVYGSSVINAEINVEDPDGFSFNFEAVGLTFGQVFDNYHGRMNEYFNMKLEKLNMLLENPNFYKEKDFLLPENVDTVNDDLETILGKCGKDNISTYCVSMGALDMHIKYVRILDSIKGRLPEIQTGFSSVDLLSERTERNKKIDEEYDEAKKVMEATIAVYNEYRLAYPMHKKYEEIIKKLTQYKLALKDIRKRVMSFPIKFIDSSTTECK